MRDDNLQQLWQEQHVEVIQMSVQELRNKAERFQRRMGWRNLREYIGAVIAFIRSGRLRVRIVTGPSRSIRSSSVMTSSWE